MLVTLVKDVALSANQSVTYSYSPKSLQKVLVRMDDAESSYHWQDCAVTVQIGSKTIVNGVRMWGLTGFSDLASNPGQASNKGFACIDCGSWEMLDNANVYVSVTCGANAITATDISLIVDEIGPPLPIKIIEYSDTVFTAPAVLGAIGYASDQGDIDDGTGSFTLTTNSYSSNFQTPSGVSYYNSEQINGFGQKAYALLCKNKVPMDTSINYSDNKVASIATMQLERASDQANKKAKNESIMAIAQARSSR